MGTAQDTIKLCKIWLAVLILVRLLTTCLGDYTNTLGVVLTTIVDSCIAGLLVAWLLTGITYKNLKVEQLRQTYTNLKLVYSDISTLHYYVGKMHSVVCAVAIKSKTAGIMSGYYDDLESDLGLYAYCKDIGLSEDSFNKLEKATGHMNEFILRLIKTMEGMQAVRLEYTDTKDDGIIHVLDELDTLVELSSELISKCRYVNTLYTAKHTNDESIKDDVLKLKETLVDLDSQSSKVLSGFLNLKPRVDSLLQELGDRLGKDRVKWDKEKKVTDTVTSCEVTVKTKDV